MKNNELLYEVALSWSLPDSGINKLSEIHSWIKARSSKINVNISKIGLDESGFWFYDSDLGRIRNKNNSFFYIQGLREKYQSNSGVHITETPIIVQEEIGYLGIICKKIDGVIHFLMQAKIEPGNVNKIQISPTIQATKSNFTQKHGGNRPAYIDYFINLNKYEVIVDQIQSEQSSRFYKKRNRNIVLYINEDIEVLPSHKWMTLGQIKDLMKINNLVNMDTRTVLSCIPYYKLGIEFYSALEKRFTDKGLFASIFNTRSPQLATIFNKINDNKMFASQTAEFVRLDSLSSWHMKNNEFVCKEPHPYKIIFCDIAIEGREVKEWTQPLLESNGEAVFGMLVRSNDGKKEFLVKVKHEIGCFDEVELGPTVQLEFVHNEVMDDVERLFIEKLYTKEGIIFDCILSEEGGRFYHEQNRNVLILLKDYETVDLTEDYMWLDYKTLNLLIQFNNVLNIQLRNLLAVLKA